MAFFRANGARRDPVFLLLYLIIRAFNCVVDTVAQYYGSDENDKDILHIF